MDQSDFEIGRDVGQYAMRWYGWGSPVGLGTFALLLAAAFALVRLAIR
jgi:hypothetical protein